MHSATKFLGGHGDLLGGVLVGPVDTLKTVRDEGLTAEKGADMILEDFPARKGRFVDVLGLHSESECFDGPVRVSIDHYITPLGRLYPSRIPVPRNFKED